MQAMKDKEDGSKTATLPKILEFMVLTSTVTLTSSGEMTLNLASTTQVGHPQISATLVRVLKVSMKQRH